MVEQGPDAESGRDALVRELMKHQSSLFAYILSIVRDFALAEEVLQEVAVVVCRQWRDFTPGTSFGAWALRIARNKIFNMNRVARREILLSQESIEAIERVAEEKAPSGWIEAVNTCIEQVGEKARALLTMRYREGLSGAEIARRTGSTLPAIHMALSRARAALAECVRRRLAEAEVE
jgi:RNA polymerase sigma-70 factor (ECF subfamily)